MEILPGGDGFAMELVSGNQDTVRLEFPVWIVHQLLRALPQIDAALHTGGRQGANGLLAYPVAGWSADPSGRDGGLAVCLRDQRHVETALHFTRDQAAAFAADLQRAQAQSPHDAARPKPGHREPAAEGAGRPVSGPASP